MIKLRCCHKTEQSLNQELQLKLVQADKTVKQSEEEEIDYVLDGQCNKIFSESAVNYFIYI